MSQAPGENKQAATNHVLPTRTLGRMTRQGRSLSGHERHCCFLNLNGAAMGGERFADISAVSGLDLDDDGRALVRVDWDFDGDQDLWISNRNAPRLRFMRNDLPAENNFLAVRLVGNGTTTNRDGIGARVDLVLEDENNSADAKKPHIQSLRAGEGYLSQNSKWLYFGLGKSRRIKKMIVHWPAGESEEFSSLQANHHHILTQGTGLAKQWTVPNPHEPLKSDAITGSKASDQSRSPLMTLIPMPQIRYEDFDGNKKRLQFGQGRAMLINLWASWCLPCMRELKEFADHENDLRQAGLEVVALTVDGLGTDETDPEIAEARLQSLDFPFASGRANGTLLKLLQTIHDQHIPLATDLPVPSSFLIDEEGKLAVIYKGTVSTEQLLNDLNHSKEDRSRRLSETTGFEGRLIPDPRIEELMARDDAQLLYLFARTATESGDLNAARKTYEEIVRLTPDFDRAHSKLGIIYLRLGNIDLAEHHLRTAIEMNPRLSAALYNLGVICAKSGRTAKAENYFEQTIRVSPKLTQAYLNLAVLLRKRNALLPARKLLDKAIINHPTNPDIYFNRGLIHAALGKNEQAVSDYTRAIEFAPNSAAIYFKRGQLFQILHRDRKAVEDYDKVIAIDPNHAMAQNNRAWILATSFAADLRNGEEAVESAKRAHDLTKPSVRYDLLDTLAAAYAETGQFEKAVEWQLKAIQRAPNQAKSDLRKRLALYQSRQPYRESAPE